MIEVTNQNYESELKTSRAFVVYFHASWCRFCTKMTPVFEKVARELSIRVKFGKVDIDKERKLAEHNNLKGVPCIIIYRNGSEFGRIVGIESEDVLREKILSHLHDIY
jgi:thioredoxin 1